MGDTHTFSSALVKPQLELVCPVLGSLMQEGCLSRRIGICREKMFCSAKEKEAAEGTISISISLMLGYRWKDQLQQGTFQIDVGKCFVQVVKWEGQASQKEGGIAVHKFV